jgi:hypothetical protein
MAVSKQATFVPPADRRAVLCSICPLAHSHSSSRTRSLPDHNDGLQIGKHTTSGSNHFRSRQVPLAKCGGPRLEDSKIDAPNGQGGVSMEARASIVMVVNFGSLNGHGYRPGGLDQVERSAANR